MLRCSTNYFDAPGGRVTPLMDTARVVLRHVILVLCLPLPPNRRKKIERWLRGREEFKRLQRADWVLVSFGNSGRTWLRVMLSRLHQKKHGLDEHTLLAFDNLKKRNPDIPAVLFSHYNYLPDYAVEADCGQQFHGKKVVLLVRDPRDTAVSQFFQWRYRMRAAKKYLNDYPAHGSDISTWEFLRDEQSGVPRIVDYCNAWAARVRYHDDLLLVRYEDMCTDPEGQLRRILAFTETAATPDEISDAVHFAAYDNMKNLEASKFFAGIGSRLRRNDKSNPESFKVRKAKVGGYRDYLTDAQCQVVAEMTARLDPVFGYSYR